MALLTSSYNSPGIQVLSTIASAVQSGRRIEAEQQAQQESMAQRLAQAAIQQQQFQQKLAFDREQQARMERAMDVQEARNRSIDERDRIRLGFEQEDRKPFTIDGGSESIIPVSASPGEALLGKITSYGYASDPHKDSASLGTGVYAKLGPTGAWDNRLRETSLAVSPDIEAAFKAAGISKGDSVALQLANGNIVNRTWDDRTMQDADAIQKFGKPLRGRFDLYSPSGVDSRDGTQVTGFRPTKSIGSEMVTAMQPGPTAPGNDPRQTIRSVAQELAAMGVTRGEARNILGRVIPQVVTTQAKATAMALGMDNLYDNEADAMQAAKQYQSDGFFGVPTFVSRAGKYALRFYNRDQDQQTRKAAEMQAKIVGSTITDLKSSAKSARSELIALEKSNDIFSSTTGLFQTPDGKWRFGQKDTRAEKSREATPEDQAKFREYLLLKSRLADMEDRLEQGREARDRLSDVVANGVNSQYFRATADQVPSRGAAPATGASAGSDLPRPQSREEFDALPAGSTYVGRDGRTYRK